MKFWNWTARVKATGEMLDYFQSKSKASFTEEEIRRILTAGYPGT